MNKKLIGLAAILMLLIALLVPLPSPAGAQTLVTRFRAVLIDHDLTVLGDTDLGSAHLQSSESTATPVIMVQNDGSSNSLELRNNDGTPVFYVDVDGNATYTGFSSGGGNISAPVRVVAPTAVGTATPAVVADSLGAGNVLLDVRDAGTPVFSVLNGGNTTHTGASSQTGNAVFSAPTAVATATPAMIVDSLGAGNVLLDIRDATTPVFSVLNGGNTTHVGTSSQTGAASFTAPTAVATAVPGLVVDGLGVSNPLEVRVDATPVFAVQDNGLFQGVIAYGTSGSQLVCGTDTVTETANVSHGLTTPTYAMCSLAADPTGDAQTCSTAIVTSVVTIKVWQSAATPTANSAGASVNWCVIGTP